MKIKTIKNKKLIIGVLALAAIVVAGGAFAYSQQSSSTAPTPVVNTSPEATINYDPPTEEEIESTEQHKQAITDREEARQNQPANLDKRAVTPTITYAGQYGTQVEIGAIVPGISEGNGTCTAKFTNGAKSFTKSVAAVKNVNSTDCPEMNAESNEFSPKGTWTTTVSYNSPVAEGISEPRQIEVK